MKLSTGLITLVPSLCLFAPMAAVWIWQRCLDIKPDMHVDAQNGFAWFSVIAVIGTIVVVGVGLYVREDGS